MSSLKIALKKSRVLGLIRDCGLVFTRGDLKTIKGASADAILVLSIDVYSNNATLIG